MTKRTLLASLLTLGLLATAAPVSAQDDSSVDTSKDPFGPIATTTALGWDVTMYPRYYFDTRELKYCEFEFFYNDAGFFDVWNTTASDPKCDAQTWNFLDEGGVAAAFGADSVEFNGPQYWAMDYMILAGTDEVPIGGIPARCCATIPINPNGTPLYTPFSPAKTQFLVYLAGNPVYQLVDPDGNTYALQARKEWVKYDDLATLGDQMTQLPDGWSYQAITPDETIVADLNLNQSNWSVADEFGQVYVQYPVQPKGVDPSGNPIES